jgi:hypothetical protein
MKMKLLYILYCPPPPTPATRYPHPAFLLAGAAARYAVTFLSAGERGGGLVLHHHI